MVDEIQLCRMLYKRQATAEVRDTNEGVVLDNFT